MIFITYHRLRFSKTVSITDTIHVIYNLEFTGIAHEAQNYVVFS
jgi:hypothetical protein